MKRYIVEVRGRGFRFAGADGLPLQAFEVTRIVEAESEAEAATVALARVAEEWTKGEFAATGVRPRLEAGNVTPLDPSARRLVHDSGYTFHPDSPLPRET